MACHSPMEKGEFIKDKIFSGGVEFPAPNENEFNTIMPWTFYADDTEEDPGAVYDFLMTQKPVKNTVEKYTPQGM